AGGRPVFRGSACRPGLWRTQSRPCAARIARRARRACRRRFGLYAGRHGRVHSAERRALLGCAQAARRAVRPVRFQSPPCGGGSSHRSILVGSHVMPNRIVDPAAPEVVLAQPRGFCAGVDRAIDIVERALELFGAAIYVRHEIVHNRYVVQDLRDKGAIFIDELDEAPKGAIVVFSAHGVSRVVREEAERMGLRIFDATCPLVTKVHVEVSRMRSAGREIIMIGHKGHPEVEGTLGQSESGMYLVETPEDVAALQVADPENLAFVTQTTLSVDDAGMVAQA